MPEIIWDELMDPRPDMKELYVEAVGHEPRPAPEEFSWQWEYRGRMGWEREKLLDLIQAEAEQEHEQLSIC